MARRSSSPIVRAPDCPTANRSISASMSLGIAGRPATRFARALAGALASQARVKVAACAANGLLPRDRSVSRDDPTLSGRLSRAGTAGGPAETGAARVKVFRRMPAGRTSASFASRASSGDWLRSPPASMPRTATLTPRSWAYSIPSRRSSSPDRTTAHWMDRSCDKTIRSRIFRVSTPFCWPAELIRPRRIFTKGSAATSSCSVLGTPL